MRSLSLKHSDGYFGGGRSAVRVFVSLTLCEEWPAIVIYFVHDDNELTDNTEASKDFVNDLEDFTDIDIYLSDETSLTTMETRFARVSTT